ncbi:MAG TPA: hypothetical protein VFK92_08850 [Burkholderiales bacterium]|nr:hypothetical protein [Burkholderiales bacterium]
MRKYILVPCFLWLAGCATPPTPVKPDSGEQLVGDRLTVTLDGSWNHIYIPGQAAEHWTMEGLPIDDLQIYSGIKDGQAMQPVARGSSATPAVFHSTMQPDEIVSLFESMLTRDGSTFQLVKSEPATFGGAKGYHFEFKVVRKVDSVELSGVGYGAVSNGELFSIVYIAPRMTFFGRYQARVENIAQGARIKGI